MPHRVLHILGSSGREGTGIARIVASLHRDIDPAKYQLSTCFVGSGGPLTRDFLARRIPTCIIPWRHPSRDLLGLFRLLRYLRTGDFQVLHFHWGGPRLRQIAEHVSDARRVLHLHSAVDEAFGGFISTAHTDAVIAVSRAVAKASQHPRTEVIYTGVSPGAGPLPEKSNSCTIGSAGRLTRIKGTSNLLQAMAYLRDCLPALHLEIAGEGPERADLEDRVAQLGLRGTVNFLGWTEPLQFNDWSMLVQPSLEEGLPLTVLEAMCAGVPVVASHVGGMPEVIEHERTGLLVSPADPRALGDAIRRVAVDHELRAAMGRAAAVRVREHFSAQRMAAEVTALYDELLSK